MSIIHLSLPPSLHPIPFHSIHPIHPIQLSIASIASVLHPPRIHPSHPIASIPSIHPSHPSHPSHTHASIDPRIHRIHPSNHPCVQQRGIGRNPRIVLAGQRQPVVPISRARGCLHRAGVWSVTARVRDTEEMRRGTMQACGRSPRVCMTRRDETIFMTKNGLKNELALCVCMARTGLQIRGCSFLSLESDTLYQTRSIYGLQKISDEEQANR